MIRGAKNGSRWATALVVVLSMVGLRAAQAAGPVEWNLDPAHSTIGFSVKHLGLSTVRGHFDSFSAKVTADEATGKITRLEGEVKANSINTGIDKRDDHLRSPDFFDVKTYPVLKLVTRRINWKGNGFEAVVDLTMHGVTKQVTFKGELAGTHVVNFGDGPQRRAGYSAEATINRQDFGLKFGVIAEGVSVVSDKVKLEIDLQISHKLAAAPAKDAPAKK